MTNDEWQAYLEYLREAEARRAEQDKRSAALMDLLNERTIAAMAAMRLLDHIRIPGDERSS